MIISYNGIESFRVQFGETTLSLGPISKSSKHKSSSFGADIVLVSLNHPDMNGADTASRGEKEPFVISGPGEYEVAGVRIKGLPSKSEYGGTVAINTVYLIELEDMHLLYLGALGSTDLPQETKEAFDQVDILFIPIGNEGVLNAVEAHKLGVSLEPSVIIPMHYDTVGEKNALTTFLKEEGDGAIKPIDKLTVKRKDLADKEGEVVVLENKNS